ncbi:MAG: hypothetical protein OJF49_000840 [Ktedonobacterales bacterium]|jgi:hypothetical protein|nr:MAG: hypothetical protein OJF49_000840 [Ktedonobacterales bacterium]
MSGQKSRRTTTPATATRHDDADAQPLATLRAYSATVTEIGAACGLDAERMASLEAIDRLEAQASIPLDQLAALPPDTVERWFALCGADLELDLQLTGLGLEDEQEIVPLRADAAPSATFARFVADAQATAANQGSDLRVNIRVALAKTRAIAAARALLATRPGHLGTPDALAATTVAVYFQSSALYPILTITALDFWEQQGLARPGGRAVIVLCDASGYLASPALEVIGAQTDAPDWLEISHDGWRQFQERADEIRHLRDAESIWTIPACSLTPEHLALTSRAPGLDATARPLAAMRESLAAMYLATSVQRASDDTLLLRFAGTPIRTLTLPHDATISGENGENSPPSSGHIPSFTPTQPPKSAESATAPAATSATSATSATAGRFSVPPSHHGEGAEGEVLSALAAWAYASAAPDRLYIARDCLAREFPAGTRIAFAEVERAARRALPAAHATFRLYLKHQTDQYFTARQQALDAVASYVASVGKAIADLTSDLVDNVYRGILLALGVMVAALLQPAQSLAVQRLAFALYALYFLVFIQLFVLRSRHEQFDAQEHELTQRLATLHELTAEERAAMRAQPIPEAARFHRYFTWSRRIYLVLGIAAAAYCLLLLTPLASHLPLVPAHATPTATPHP